MMRTSQSDIPARSSGSRFIRFWRRLFVLASSLFLFISILPNVLLFKLYAEGVVDSATFPAHNMLEVVFYSNLRLFAALFTLLNLLWLFGAIGMLRRRDWSRPLLTIVLCFLAVSLLLVLSNFLAFDYEITAWRDPERNERFKAYFPWALGGGVVLLVGLIYRLNTGRVARELS